MLSVIIIVHGLSCNLVPLVVLVSDSSFLGVFWASVDRKNIFYIELF